MENGRKGEIRIEHTGRHDAFAHAPHTARTHTHACKRTSVGSVESCTPPLKPLEKVPLPRPPAKICAFITISGAPVSMSHSAAALASAPLVAILNRWEEMPYSSISSLDWNLNACVRYKIFATVRNTGRHTRFQTKTCDIDPTLRR